MLNIKKIFQKHIDKKTAKRRFKAVTNRSRRRQFKLLNISNSSGSTFS